MTTLPLISVVVPCFNAGAYIGNALQSVLAQDWPALDVVVVDDGSSDGSAERVRQQFPSVRVLQQANQGAAAARNLGIREARGDWIAFLDADDLWLPGKLRAQWQLLASLPAARMAYAAWHVWPSTAAEPTAAELTRMLSETDASGEVPGPSGWIYPALLLDCEVWTSTVIAQRSLFDEIGVFDTSLHIGEDYDLWLRASQATAILRAPQPYALYRSHPASLTRGAPTANHRAVVIARALARWGYSGPDGRSARKADVDRALGRTWGDYAAAHLAAGNMTAARRASLVSIRMAPWQQAGWRVLANALAQSLWSSAPPRR